MVVRKRLIQAEGVADTRNRGAATTGGNGYACDAIGAIPRDVAAVALWVVADEVGAVVLVEASEVLVDGWSAGGTCTTVTPIPALTRAERFVISAGEDIDRPVELHRGDLARLGAVRCTVAVVDRLSAGRCHRA